MCSVGTALGSNSLASLRPSHPSNFFVFVVYNVGRMTAVHEHPRRPVLELAFRTYRDRRPAGEMRAGVAKEVTWWRPVVPEAVPRWAYRASPSASRIMKGVVRCLRGPASAAGIHARGQLR